MWTCWSLCLEWMLFCFSLPVKRFGHLFALLHRSKQILIYPYLTALKVDWPVDETCSFPGQRETLPGFLKSSWMDNDVTSLQSEPGWLSYLTWPGVWLMSQRVSPSESSSSKEVSLWSLTTDFIWSSKSSISCIVLFIKESIALVSGEIVKLLW